VNLLYCYLSYISSLFLQDFILDLYYILIIIKRCLNTIDNLKDLDLTKRFLVYTTLANAVHL
jgi:hypothetical protein